LGLALDEPSEADSKLSLNGIELLAEKSLNSFLDGQVIDFVNSGMQEGFVISPEFNSSCC
jgi:Fe-S cluster assembly iron-binding protein IscA